MLNSKLNINMTLIVFRSLVLRVKVSKPGHIFLPPTGSGRIEVSLSKTQNKVPAPSLEVAVKESCDKCLKYKNDVLSGGAPAPGNLVSLNSPFPDHLEITGDSRKEELLPVR